MAVLRIRVDAILHVDGFAGRGAIHRLSDARNVVGMDNLEELLGIGLEIGDRLTEDVLVGGVDEQQFRPVAVEHPQYVADGAGDRSQSALGVAAFLLRGHLIGDVPRADDVASSAASGRFVTRLSSHTHPPSAVAWR